MLLIGSIALTFIHDFQTNPASPRWGFAFLDRGIRDGVVCSAVTGETAISSLPHGNQATGRG